MAKYVFKMISFDTCGTKSVREIESTTINGAQKIALREAFGITRAIYVVDEKTGEKYKCEIGEWRKCKTEEERIHAER